MKKSFFQKTCIFFLIVTAGFSVSGCAKHPKPGESAIPSPAAPAAEQAASPAPVLTLEEMKKIVVARVNGVEIHEDALFRMTNVMSANTPGASVESREEIRKKALDQVVLRELALQEAARQGLRVNQQEFERAMGKFVQSMGHDEGFEEYLKEQHLTAEEVRAQIERSLLLQQLFNKEVLQKISVSDDEVRKEYELNKDKNGTPEKPITFEEAKGPIEKKLKAVAQVRRVQEWELELKKDAKIEIVNSGAK